MNNHRVPWPPEVTDLQRRFRVFAQSAPVQISNSREQTTKCACVGYLAPSVAVLRSNGIDQQMRLAVLVLDACCCSEGSGQGGRKSRIKIIPTEMQYFAFERSQRGALPVRSVGGVFVVSAPSWEPYSSACPSVVTSPASPFSNKALDDEKGGGGNCQGSTEWWSGVCLAGYPRHHTPRMQSGKTERPRGTAPQHCVGCTKQKISQTATTQESIFPCLLPTVLRSGTFISLGGGYAGGNTSWTGIIATGSGGRG